MYFCLKSILMKKFTFVILILPFILVSPFIFAQNGPGGVGSPSNLNLWLKTDNLNLSEGDLVEFWYDSSDNNNTASQLTQQNRPIFRATSSLNNLPVIDFSGGDDSSTSDFMTIPGDASNFGGINQMSLFSVLGQVILVHQLRKLSFQNEIINLLLFIHLQCFSLKEIRHTQM